jgi:hypothetical protein
MLTAAAGRISPNIREMALCRLSSWDGKGDLAGKRFVIGDAPVTFGRDEDNDIVIADRAVSRLPAEHRQEADGFVLTNRGGSNDTWMSSAAR